MTTKGSVHLYIPGIPIPWRAPYVGTRGAFSPRTALMNQMRLSIKSSYRGPFFTTPIIMDVDFIMPIPKGTSKKNVANMLNDDLRPAKIPDLDNLRKFISDLLQGVCYENDSLIVGGRSDKWYGQEPKTVVEIWDCETRRNV